MKKVRKEKIVVRGGTIMRQTTNNYRVISELINLSRKWFPNNEKIRKVQIDELLMVLLFHKTTTELLREQVLDFTKTNGLTYGLSLTIARLNKLKNRSQELELDKSAYNKLKNQKGTTT